MKVLVTGGMGFIGSHLVDSLVSSGHGVVSFDNLEKQVHGGKRPKYLNKGARYIAGDMRNIAQLKKALKGVEVIFHQASVVGVGQSMYKIADYIDSNTYGTANLLDSLVNYKNKVKKLIVASSMSIYGEGSYKCGSCGEVTPPLREEGQLKRREWEMKCPKCEKEAEPAATPEGKNLSPTSIYAMSKRHQEEMCLLIGKTYNIPTVALRYFNVYGPRQSLSNPYTGVCAIFSARIKNNHRPLIYEDGLQTRDFIHVSDIAGANLLVMNNSEADYKVFNVGSGSPVSILEIAKTLAKLHGKEIEPEVIDKYRKGDIRHCVADISAINSLGFRPRVNFNDGMCDLVNWAKIVPAQDNIEIAYRELQNKGLTPR